MSETDHVDRKPTVEDLLDWHLERLGDDERAWIESALLRDPETRGKSDRIRTILEPLDQWTTPTPPPNLAARVLAHVEREAGAVRPPDIIHLSESGAPPPRGVSWRDLLAVAACIALLVSVMFPGMANLRQRSRQRMCAANLGSVFQGLAAYQQAYAGMLPFAGSAPGTSWLPNGNSNAPYASNSRNAYILVRLSFGPRPRNFVCPSNPTGVPMEAENYADRDDFAEARNITYDTLNLAGAATTPEGAEQLRPPPWVAYAGDTNPLFVDGRFDEAVDPYATNSPAHGNDTGQCVLALDGSAAWMTTPNVGTRHDNIWLAGTIRRYEGTETRQDPGDSFLVPGYPNGEPDIPGRRAE